MAGTSHESPATVLKAKAEARSRARVEAQGELRPFHGETGVVVRFEVELEKEAPIASGRNDPGRTLADGEVDSGHEPVCAREAHPIAREKGSFKIPQFNERTRGKRIPHRSQNGGFGDGQVLERETDHAARKHREGCDGGQEPQACVFDVHDILLFLVFDSRFKLIHRMRRRGPSPVPGRDRPRG